MGQSDTESTTSSMHGNPGSPRDLSILTEEAHTSFNMLPRHLPSTSNERMSDLNNSVIFNGERPKSRQREIPVIDLTSQDHDDERQADREATNSSEMDGVYQDFAARVQRQLNATRERIARMRADHHHLRLHALRSRMQSCPYITTYRPPGRRPWVPSPTPRGRTRGMTSTASGPVRVTSPITVDDSPVVQNNEASSEIFEISSDSIPEEASPTEHRYSWRRRLSRDSVLQRLQETSPCNEESDEALARRLQAQFDQELVEDQPQSESDDSPLLSHSPTDLSSVPLSLPLHFRRRRHYHRRHGVSFNLTQTGGLPELLLPFVSMSSLPPPLHHFEPGQANSNDSADYEALWNLSERIGPAKARGLTKEAIDRIPSFRYSASNKEMSNGNCVVCMMDYTNREKLRKLPCTHDFHSKCIDRWLRSNKSCPVCREVVSTT